jgi:SAM-dependent methyltransferase
MHQPAKDSTTRFSNRVENYVRYRPSYPAGIIPILQQETQLSAASAIADVGSGTGLSTELFLRNGNEVFGIEPNAEMRRAAEEWLKSYSNFHSIAATAENTTLPAASINYVVAGQAFHWFDRNLARQEFARVLQPGGWVVLFWNARRTNSSSFLRAYETLLQEFGTDYREVRHEQVDASVIQPFFCGEFATRRLVNEQRFDFDGLKGRLLSSSYVPSEDDPNHAPMIRELQRIFEIYNDDNGVRFEYDTVLYFGHLS